MAWLQGKVMTVEYRQLAKGKALSSQRSLREWTAATKLNRSRRETHAWVRIVLSSKPTRQAGSRASGGGVRPRPKGCWGQGGARYPGEEGSPPPPPRGSRDHLASHGGGWEHRASVLGTAPGAVKGAQNTPSHLIVPDTCSQQVKTILLTYKKKFLLKQKFSKWNFGKSREQYSVLKLYMQIYSFDSSVN